MTEPDIVITGRVAAAPEEYGPDSVIIFLDHLPEPRKFKAGELVTVKTGGLS